MFKWSFVILFLLMIYGISWLLTCGLYAFIAWCFSLKFSWKIATGVWVVWCVILSLFAHGAR